MDRKADKARGEELEREAGRKLGQEGGPWRTRSGWQPVLLSRPRPAAAGSGGGEGRRTDRVLGTSALFAATGFGSKLWLKF